MTDGYNSSLVLEQMSKRCITLFLFSLHSSLGTSFSVPETFHLL